MSSAAHSGGEVGNTALGRCERIAFWPRVLGAIRQLADGCLWAATRAAPTMRFFRTFRRQAPNPLPFSTSTRIDWGPSRVYHKKQDEQAEAKNGGSRVSMLRGAAGGGHGAWQDSLPRTTAKTGQSSRLGSRFTTPQERS